MKKKIWTIVFVLVFLLMLVGEGFAIAAVINLDMLPELYLYILIGFFVLFSLAIGLLLFYPGKKYGKFSKQHGENGKIRRIVACVLAAVFAGVCLVLTTVATDVMKTLEAATQEVLEIPTRDVYVRVDNPVQELKDTGAFTFGYLKDFDEDCTNQALDKVYETTGTDVYTAGFNSLVPLTNALLEGRIDAMILNGGILSVLEEMEEFAGFSENIRVLEQIRVEETAVPEDGLLQVEEEESEQTEQTTIIEQEETVATEPVVEYTTLKPFVVYVSGSDSHDKKLVAKGRNDVNILAAVNPMTKQVVLINTPRDYYISNVGVGGGLDKLTHCGLKGIQNSMNTLARLYDTDVEYFVQINFTGFKKMIDALGGITVYSDYAFTAITRTKIVKGENHLNGQQALDFARERKTISGGDFARGDHQMQVIKAVIEKATTGTTVINNYNDIMASVEGMFQMNVPTELISDLMKMQLSDMARWNIVSYGATGSFASEQCYSVPGMELSVVKPNYDSVSKATRLINMVLNGELLTEEVVAGIK